MDKPIYGTAGGSTRRVARSASGSQGVCRGAAQLRPPSPAGDLPSRLPSTVSRPQWTIERITEMGNTISPNTHLFAAYVGLTISGYDMADDRDLEIQELIRKVRSLHWPPAIARYFAVARTGKVKVNPYWPRGSMLSTASLHIGPDHRFAQADESELERVFLQAENIGPEDKAPDLLAWVMRLPEMVVIIMEHPAYAELWNSYLTIIQQRCAKWEDLVQGSLTSVTKT
ncbi:MAG: hypothetical protein ACM3ZQ_12030, partial [Bacillota bacterium]